MIFGTRSPDQKSQRAPRIDAAYRDDPDGGSLAGRRIIT